MHKQLLVPVLLWSLKALRTYIARYLGPAIISYRAVGLC